MISETRAELIARVYKVDLSDLLPDQRPAARARLAEWLMATGGHLGALVCDEWVLAQVAAGVSDTDARSAIADALKRWEVKDDE